MEKWNVSDDLILINGVKLACKITDVFHQGGKDSHALKQRDLEQFAQME